MSTQQAKTAVLTAIEPIPVADLRVAEWNARKTFDPIRAEELKSSIRQHGVQVPLLVRPLSLGSWQTLADVDAIEAGAALYEIVAGHRRYAAARSLALETVPCIVRAMTDDEARERGLVDNLQREDVPALEEAAAYEELRQRLGTPAAIAAAVGKPVAYVAQRLQLVSLGEQPRRALAERLITVDHALLLARLGKEEQDANLKWALDPNAGLKKSAAEVIDYRLRDREQAGRYGWKEAQSVLSLKDHIEQHVGRKLSRAPWDLEDATLTAAGACTGCPSNTRANAALFGDLAIEEATCEDGACFERKRAAFVQIQLERALSPVRLSWKDSTAAPGRLHASTDQYLASTFRRGQWVEAKKGSCGFVHAGVTVDWSDAGVRGYMGRGGALRKPGEVLTVCVAAGCKAHPKAWEKAQKAPDSSADAEARKEREAQQEQACATERQLRMGWAIKAVAATKKLPEAALRRILLDLVEDSCDGDWEEIEQHLFPRLRETLESAPLQGEPFARAVAVLLIAFNELDLASWQGPEHGRDRFLAALKLLGVDARPGWQKPKPAKTAAKKAPAKKAPAKKAPAKKAAKKGGRA